ncbi:hypothetical protein MSAN_01088400 [Mycena sanguinolenta]|uniref:Uncharacterized protein n=1 Tax=Mycena sanguinolenta TaxID=230812 RepID=A0A8H7D7I8_9AGAR|nr:hypothetical protein MSAN_01088400 [Mycena sanguinolenta]
MSHTSPASYLVWGIVSAIIFIFLVYHMYSFDRFRCLRWNHNAGAFKRIMTYSYLLGVPMIMTFALGSAAIKYRQGFIVFEGAIVPKPYQLWPEADQKAIFPLMLMFTVAWSFEMITHLEELCFWYFVVKSSGQQNWFRSRYFRVWVVGSCCAITYMPLLTILTRHDALKSEAFTFLGGSIGSLCLTLCFAPILWAFPEFLAGLKSAGVDNGTIVRLTKFHELNTIRVIFRFIFVVPLFTLGVDGVRAHKHINEYMIWTDFLTMISGFGCGISSALTLVIFFPRNIEDEIAAKEAAREKRRSRRSASLIGVGGEFSSQVGILPPADYYPPSIATEQPIQYTVLPSLDGHGQPTSPLSTPQVVHKEWHYDRARDVHVAMSETRLTPVRRPSQKRHYLQKRSSVNAVVHNFTSPIDVS